MLNAVCFGAKRKVKWCKMQVLFLKTDRTKDVKGKK